MARSLCIDPSAQEGCKICSLVRTVESGLGVTISRGALETSAKSLTFIQQGEGWSWGSYGCSLGQPGWEPPAGSLARSWKVCHPCYWANPYLQAQWFLISGGKNYSEMLAPSFTLTKWGILPLPEISLLPWAVLCLQMHLPGIQGWWGVFGSDVGRHISSVS